MMEAAKGGRPIVGDDRPQANRLEWAAVRGAELLAVLVDQSSMILAKLTQMERRLEAMESMMREDEGEWEDLGIFPLTTTLEDEED